MNFSLPFGIFIGVSIIIWTITGEVTNPLIFANAPAIAIVIGGTIAASLVCFPISHLFNIVKVIWRATTTSSQKKSVEVIEELVVIAEKVQSGQDALSLIEGIRNPFLKESMIVANEGAISDEDLESVLIKRVEIQNETYRQEASVFKIIGKFPPAFGLIGTTLGMVALLQSLGGEGAFQQLGPSMSVSLTATFWGLIVANLFLVPIGENLSLISQHDLITRRIIAEGVLLVKEGKHPVVIEEYLKSYLSPSIRNKLKHGA